MAEGHPAVPSTRDAMAPHDTHHPTYKRIEYAKHNGNCARSVLCWFFASLDTQNHVSKLCRG